MKYLTEDMMPLFEQKYFEALNIYRLVKSKIDTIQNQGDRELFLKKVSEEEEKAICLVETDKFCAPELKDYRKTQLKAVTASSMEKYDAQAALLNELPGRLETALATARALHRLKMAGVLTEADVKVLQNPINKHFYDELLAKLEDTQPLNFNHDALNIYKELEPNQIESEFGPLAEKMVKESQSKKELRKVTGRISLFPSSSGMSVYTDNVVLDFMYRYFLGGEPTLLPRAYGFRGKCVFFKSEKERKLKRLQQQDERSQEALDIKNMLS